MRDPIKLHSLEYPITEHCNLRCANCDHASPVLDEQFTDLETYVRDLAAVSGIVEAREFRILGGEPLLHPQLIDFLRIARESGLAETITLVTNGVLLHKASPEMWTLIDRLWLSVYPRVKIRLDVESIRLVCEQHGVIPDIRTITSFHQTIMNYKNDDPCLVQQIYGSCKLAHEWKCYTLYNGYFYKCAPSPFLDKRLVRRGLTPTLAIDGIKLSSASELQEELLSYLSSERPLEACSYCLGSSGPEVNHHQLNGVELVNILSANDPPYTGLVHDPAP